MLISLLHPWLNQLCVFTAVWDNKQEKLVSQDVIVLRRTSRKSVKWVVDQLKRYLVTAGSWALLYINLQHVASVDSSIMFSVLFFSQK